jgi:hypothetical protein
MTTLLVVDARHLKQSVKSLQNADVVNENLDYFQLFKVLEIKPEDPDVEIVVLMDEPRVASERRFFGFMQKRIKAAVFCGNDGDYSMLGSLIAKAGLNGEEVILITGAREAIGAYMSAPEYFESWPQGLLLAYFRSELDTEWMRVKNNQCMGLFFDLDEHLDQLFKPREQTAAR